MGRTIWGLLCRVCRVCRVSRKKRSSVVGAADPEGTHLPLLLAVITWLVPDGRQAVQLDRLPDSHDRPQRDPMHPSRPLDGCAAPARLRQTETACSLRALSRVLCDTLRSVYSSGSRLGAGFRGHATGPGALDSVGSGPDSPAARFRSRQGRPGAFGFAVRRDRSVRMAARPAPWCVPGPGSVLGNPDRPAVPWRIQLPPLMGGAGIGRWRASDRDWPAIGSGRHRIGIGRPLTPGRHRGGAAAGQGSGPSVPRHTVHRCSGQHDDVAMTARPADAMRGGSRTTRPERPIHARRNREAPLHTRPTGHGWSTAELA